MEREFKRIIITISHNKRATLRFDKINIGRKEARKVTRALARNTSLTAIDLNRADMAGSRTKLFQILTLHSNLCSLNLSGALKHPTRVFGTQIGDFLVHNSTLTHLDVSKNDLGNDAINTIAQALRINASLRSLNLNDNHVGPKGAAHLAHALSMNTTLAWLNVSACRMREGTAALVRGLCRNKTLTALNINSNFFRVYGLECVGAVADLLIDNPTLVRLNLSSNTIGDDGAAIIAAAVKTNSTLTCLKLNHTSIRDVGIRDIFQALKSNLNVTTLDLSGNTIRDSVETIGEVLKYNPTLTSLDLSYAIDPTQYNRLQNVIAPLYGNSTLKGLLLENNAVAYMSPIFLDIFKYNGTLADLGVSAERSNSAKDRIRQNQTYW
jgi:Ran GTPase-activating protein (RanGAP) involved in mRNA processing and transport